MSYTYRRVTNGENDRTTFGIGINAQGTNSGSMRGRHMDVACQCWFTSKGDTTPLVIKFMDPNGEVQTVRNIHVNYKEEKNYDGISSVEYDCSIFVNEREYPVKLLFFKEECRWMMRIP